MHLVKINEVSIRHVGHVFKEFAEITVAPSCDYYCMPDYPWHRFCLRVVNYLPYRVSRSTLTAVAGVLSCWPDGLQLTPGFYPGSNEQHRLF